MRARHYWTDEERERVIRLRAEGWTAQEIARREGLREAQVENLIGKLQAQGHVLPRKDRWQGTLTYRDVSGVMGLGWWAPAKAWIDSGLLKSKRLRHRHVIYPADLVEFLQAHPAAYQAWRMPERVDGKLNPFLPYARRCIDQPELLTAKQAA